MEQENYLKRAEELELIPAALKEIFVEDRIMSRKEMIILAADYLERFKTPSDLKYIRGEYFD